MIKPSVRGEHPQVSVVMPTFNVESYVSRAIASVQAQTFPDWEMVVVDDCSIDATCERVAQLSRDDPRIKLVRRARNGGAGAARNVGLDSAVGRWIALIDADDRWKPERLARLVDVGLSTGAEFIADNQIYFDDYLGEETGQAFDLPQYLSRVTAVDLFKSEADGQFPLSLLKPLISREYLRKADIRYSEYIRFAEDMHLYARLLISGISAVVMNDAMYIYTTPVGKQSTVKSAGSRTVNAASTKMWIADDIEMQYGNEMTSELRREIAAYKRRAGHKHYSQQLSQMRRDKAWVAAFLSAVKNPGATYRYAFKSRALNRIKADNITRGIGSSGPVSVALSPFHNGETAALEATSSQKLMK